MRRIKIALGRFPIKWNPVDRRKRPELMDLSKLRAPVRAKLALVTISTFLGGAAAAAGANNFEMPAMPVHDALVVLAQKAGLSIAFDDFDLDGYRSRRILAASTIDKALDTILATTPYTYELTGDDTVKLVVRPPVSSDHDAHAGIGAPVASAPPDVILVTAMKRRDDARRLPVAVSAIDAEILSVSGADELKNVTPRIAGLAFTNLGTSRNKIFVRGLSDGPFADRTQSTVGVYLDETPINLNDTNPDLRLFDMERIEVVRGPQGSLYGGGSIGGLFRMVTRKPDLDQYAASLQLSGLKTQGGGAGGSADIMINTPLVADKLALRAVAYHQRAGGYIDDVGLFRHNINSSQISGGRLALRYAPFPRWTIDAQFATQHVHLDGAQYTFADGAELSRATQRPEPYVDAFNVGSLTVNGDLGSVQVMSSTAYVRRETENDLDASAALPLLVGVPGALGVYRRANQIGTLTHEARIASANDERWRWLIGAFFTARNETLSSRLIVDSSHPVNLAFVSDRTDEFAEAALFGETSYAFADQWNVTFGARLTRTTSEVDVVSSGVVKVGEPVVDVKRTQYTVSPKLGVTYQHRPDVMLYGQISNGGRTGGVNVTTPLEALFDIDGGSSTGVFDADSLWNFEVGAKSSWFGGALDVNTSLFYVIWSDIQTDQFLPNGFSFIANAGRARNYGFELETLWRPIENLDLTAAVFWNSPELRTANPFLGAAAGDALPNIAEVSAGVSATYELAISGRWSAALTGDVAYVGHSDLTFQEGVAPPMGDYINSNLRFSFSRDRLKMGLFVENVSNERGNSFSFGNPFSLSVAAQETPLRPRTIGVFLKQDF
jgi:outer membrane receptor protein involved in Fe transport